MSVLVLREKAIELLVVIQTTLLVTPMKHQFFVCCGLDESNIIMNEIQ